MGFFIFGNLIKESYFCYMNQQDTTNSVRIDTDLLEKIRKISKKNGQTIIGYISVALYQKVNRDWERINKKNQVV